MRVEWIKLFRTGEHGNVDWIELAHLILGNGSVNWIKLADCYLILGNGNVDWIKLAHFYFVLGNR